MTVPSRRDESNSKAIEAKLRRFSKPRRPRLTASAVEPLEARQLMTFSATLAGNLADFSVGSTTDSVTFSQSGGLLQHNTLTAPAGQSFADNFDFDSTVPGSQTLAATGASQVEIGNVNPDAYNVTLGTPTSPASTVLSQFILYGNAGSSASIDDSGSTTANIFTETASSISGTGLQASLSSTGFGNGLALTTGSAQDTIEVQGTSAGELRTLQGSGNDIVNVGDGTIDLVNQLRGPLNVEGTSSTLTVTALSGSANNAILTGTSLTGFTAAGAPIGFANLNSLAIVGGNGSSDDTINNTPTAPTTLSTGTGTTTVEVLADSGTLAVTNTGGADLVTVGNGGQLSGVSQALLVTNTGGSTAVTIDDSADTSNTNATLIETAANTATLSNLGPAAITLGTNNGEVATIRSGSGGNRQTVDFSAGNPIPNGLSYTGGGGTNNLILTGTLPGGPLTDELFNSTGDGTGTIDLGGASLLSFTRAKPVTDLITADNFTFADSAGQDARIFVDPGNTVGPTPTALISTEGDLPTNKQLVYGNKAVATIDTGPGDDVVFLDSKALPPGSNTVVNGQAGINTLNYDASGQIATVSPVPGSPGEATITRPGSGTLLVENFQHINVTNGFIKEFVPTSVSIVASAQVRGFVGAPLTNVDVATFTSDDLSATAADFGSTITWGDGTTTAGEVVADSSTPTIFHIEGSHTYTGPSPLGGYPINVTVEQNPNDTTTIPGVTLRETNATSRTTDTVNPAYIEGLSNVSSSAPISGVVEGASFSGTIASFNDNVVLPPSSTTQYVATIAWGDGSSQTGFVTASATPGQYDVSGFHTYQHFGTYTPTVTINDVLAPVGGTLTIARELDVASAAITPAATSNFTATAGTPLTAVFANFQSANPFATASDFHATITFADGFFTPGIITEDGNGFFTVTGTHTFTSPTPGNIITFARTDVTEGESVASKVVNGTVLDAPLTAQGSTVAVTAREPLLPTNFATFTYGLPNASASNFSATINWGDGTSTTFGPGEGISAVGGSGGTSSFTVSALHSYANFGTFATSIAIQSAGGATALATGTAVVADFPIHGPAPLPISVVEGTQFLLPIGTFNNSFSANFDDFIATIDWGDGTSSDGFISEDSFFTGAYTVSGRHTYTQPGNKTAVVSIRDTLANGGSTATIVVPVTVTGAPLTPAQGIFEEATDRAPFTGVVGMFGSANPSATAADFTATINWGDGSAPSVGTLKLGANGGFEVCGTHTYLTPANFSNPFQVSVQVQEVGTTNGTTLTSSAIVFDAPLTAQGATVTAVAGNPLTQDLVASFLYGGGDLPTSNFSGTVNWGDGTTSPLIASNFTDIQPPTVNQAYTINATHTYASQGTYPVSVTINSLGGSSAVASGTAIVSDALSVNVTPIAITAGVSFSNQIVATVTDSGTLAPTSKYAATINWGDGTPVVPGTVMLGINATLNILGSHTYAGPGPYVVSVTATNNLGGITTGTGLFFVGAAPVAPINLTGALDLASDSGISDTDAITNVTTPRFFGSATPGTLVYLYAIPVGTNIPVPIGQTVTDATGAWSITSIKLANGRYNVEAIGVDPSGQTSVLDVLLPNALQGPLVIDTVAPKITNVQFEPLTGRVLITFQDDSAGLNEGSIIDGANYAFSFVGPLPGINKKVAAAEKAKPYDVSGVSTTPQLMPTQPQTVVVTIDNNQPIRGGLYRITVLSGGIDDAAGNALDGTFYGYFPSGNNHPGGNFVANLDSIHNTVLQPLPVTTSASPLANPGILPKKVFVPTVNPTRIRIVSGAQPINALPGQFFPGTFDPTTTSAKALKAHDAAIAQVSVKKVAKPKA